MDALNKPLGVLVVGVGFLGAQRAAAAKALRRTRLVGVHDVDRIARSAVAARFGTVEFESWETALERPDVDIVVVATPHSDHAEIVSRSLHAGKHVLCEKPLALDPGDAFALAKLADDSRLQLATGLNHRFYPPVSDALALANSWSLGRVESVRVEIGHAATSDFLQSWHTDMALSGGGTLVDNGPHACDLIRMFIGEVVSAKGYVQSAPGGDPRCDFEAFGLFRGHEHVTAELHSGWNLRRGYMTIDIRGDDGHLRVETAPWRLSGALRGGRRIDRSYVARRGLERLNWIRYGCEGSLLVELDDFAAGCLGRPRQGANGWDGFRVAEMVQAVYDADASGEEVLIKADMDFAVPPSTHRREAAGRFAVRS